jgi:hypothetical protein
MIWPVRHAEEFMRDFLRARIVEEQRYQASRLPFRSKFFADDCWYDSRADTIRRMESEKIVSIEQGTSDSTVITEQVIYKLGGIKTMRFRYHLQTVNEDWVIRDVLIACLMCGGGGDSSCPYCKGKHWVDTRHRGAS